MYVNCVIVIVVIDICECGWLTVKLNSFPGISRGISAKFRGFFEGIFEHLFENNDTNYRSSAYSLLLIDTLATLYITSCFPMILSYNWPNNNTANITISKANN